MLLSQNRRRGVVAAIMVAVATAATVFTAPTVEAAPATGTPASPEPQAWIIVDAGTGNVLDGKDIHTPHHSASMAKVITALTALDHFENAAQITVTQSAVDHAGQNTDVSGMALGQTWSLDSVIGQMMVISANDAAYSVGSAITPNLSDFGAAATKTARRIGMNESTFNDPAGLDDSTSIGGGPMISAFDMAIAVRNARSVPMIKRWAALAKYDFTDPAGIKHATKNHNFLLAGLTRAYTGANGFKTGQTKLAGGTLAATATRNGRTIIAVVMNTTDKFGWAQQFLDRGFATALGSPGNGERVPAVRYQSLSQRMAAQRDFLTLAVRPAFATAAAPTTKPTRYQAASTTTAAVKSSKDSGAKATAQTKTTVAKSADSGSSGTVAVLVILAALSGAFIVRREQVKRQKARRRARQRSMQAALRRGSLPVVDGRYRPGMRTGPPVASNVKVRKPDGED